jgi:hypothetical protein
MAEWIFAKRSVDSRNLAHSKGVPSEEKRENQRLMSIGEGFYNLVGVACLSRIDELTDRTFGLKHEQRVRQQSGSDSMKYLA